MRYRFGLDLASAVAAKVAAGLWVFLLLLVIVPPAMLVFMVVILTDLAFVVLSAPLPVKEDKCDTSASTSKPAG